MGALTDDAAVLEQLRRLLEPERAAAPGQALHETLHRLAGWRVQYLTRLAQPLVVQGGPFAGMQYVQQAIGSSLLPKLLGAYEAELHPLLTHLARQPFQTIINIGCGEGYYAVGLARALPTCRVLAFDSQPRAQELCRELAHINGVGERVQVQGECTAQLLNSMIQPATLVFCDCEGGEVELLDLARVPALRHCDLVVEMHDFLDARISRLITERFAPTHSAIRIEQAGRDPSDYPLLRNFSQLDQVLALWEGRPGPTPWVYLRCFS